MFGKIVGQIVNLANVGTNKQFVLQYSERL